MEILKLHSHRLSSFSAIRKTVTEVENFYSYRYFGLLTYISNIN